MTKKRRTPRRPPRPHNVRAHSRDGHPVGSYSRGSGSIMRTPVRPSRSKDNAEAFVVTMKYKDGSKETVNVIAPKGNYEKAISEGLEERTHTDKPVEINILDPSLGEVIRFLGKGIGKGLGYVKRGVKKASPGVKAGLKKGAIGVGKGIVSAGKGLGESIKTYSQEKEAVRLVNLSYSPNPGVRATSRKKLKDKYPEIYDNCDFSKRGSKAEISRQRKALKKKSKKKGFFGL